MPSSINSHAQFLSHPPIEPGTICHLGVVGPGQTTNDVRFMNSDDGGLWLQFPQRGVDREKEFFSWGDIIEFWPLPTIWLLRIEPHEASTHTEYRTYSNRIKAREAMMKLAEKWEPHHKDLILEKALNFENTRNYAWRFGRFIIFPTRLNQEG